MQPENQSTSTPLEAQVVAQQQPMPQQKDSEYLALDIDDIEEVEFGDDDNFANLEPKAKKENRSKIRKNIEEILAERALQRELADVFDEDILLD